jgi:hypothetical protein
VTSFRWPTHSYFEKCELKLHPRTLNTDLSLQNVIRIYGMLPKMKRADGKNKNVVMRSPLTRTNSKHSAWSIDSASISPTRPATNSVISKQASQSHRKICFAYVIAFDVSEPADEVSSLGLDETVEAWYGLGTMSEKRRQIPEIRYTFLSSIGPASSL